MSSSLDEDISVLSLNCWGLKWISKHRQARLDAIADRIAESTFDLVALQELWVYSDFENLVKKTSHVLPYAKLYFSGVLGGGLAILSKWPFESTTMWRYPLNGRPTAFWRGDWYVGKGIAIALIRHPSGQLIELFNTHTHAPYGHGDNSYSCHRLAQAWEMSKLLRASARRDAITIGVGDFNMVPGSIAHTLITTNGLVTDSWLAVHPECLSNPPDKLNYSPIDRIRKLGVTSNSTWNTWRANRNEANSKRLDYVFINQRRAEVVDSLVVFTELVPKLRCSYSDHFGISVKLRLINEKQGEAETHSTGILSCSLFDTIDKISNVYLARQVRQSRWRIASFFVAVVVFLGALVGQWWIEPEYGHFILLLGTVLIMVYGTVDGLIGFVFGRWELRALKEFVSEMQLARTAYTKEWNAS